LVCHILVTGCNATVGDRSHLRDDTEDLRSNGDGDAVLTRTVVRGVSGTVTRCGNAIDDGHQVFVIGWVPVTLVANADIAIEKRKFEGFVLGAFEHTIRRVEPLE
jgi:hypothetical protein